MMPDVFTHLMVGTSVALLARRDDNRVEQMLIVLGSVLIDIERPVTWLLEGTPLKWIGLGSAFHSILGAVVLSYFAAVCFNLDGVEFKNRFLLILMGCASHLLLDLIMYPWVEIGLYILYPLKIPFSFNLLWPDFWLFPVFGFVIFLIAICFRYILTYQKENVK